MCQDLFDGMYAVGLGHTSSIHRWVGCAGRLHVQHCSNMRLLCAVSQNHMLEQSAMLQCQLPAEEGQTMDRLFNITGSKQFQRFFCKSYYDTPTN